MTIFMDSFQYTIAQVSRKWADQSLGVTNGISSDSPYNTSSIGLSASFLGTNWSVYRRSIGNAATYSICFSLKKSMGALEDRIFMVANLIDGSQSQLGLWFSAGEKLGIYRGNGTASSPQLLAEVDHAFVRNNWYHIRWKVTISDSCPANSNQLQVVGPNVSETVTVPTSTATRVTTANQASVFEITNRLISGATASANDSVRTHRYSDIYVSNEEAVLLPNLRVHPLRPTGNGTTVDWTPNTGAAWDAIDDLTPDDDTTRISTSTDAHTALFQHAGLPTPAASVVAIQMSALSKKDDAFDVALEPVYRIAGTNYPVGESTVGNAYAAVTSATNEDPAAVGPWTGAVVNAMEIGVRVKHG
jgi:hypothetical protein